MRRVFIVIATAGQTHTDSVWNIALEKNNQNNNPTLEWKKCKPNALGPEEFVEARVDAHIRGAHLLFSKFLHLLDGTWGAVFEAAENEGGGNFEFGLCVPIFVESF